MALPINNNQPLGATRVHGDAAGVVNFDIGMAGDTSTGIIIATGLTKGPTAFGITANVTLTSELGVGGVVETVLRRVGVASTTTMYQVDGAQISLLLEATGFEAASNVAAALNSPVISTTANVANIVPVGFTVTNVGFKLATA